MVLAQALVAGEKMDWLVQKAVELGVAAVVPLETERAVVRLDAGSVRAAKRVEHLRQVAIAACEQCGRNRIPEVRPVTGLLQFLAGEAGRDALRLMPSPGAERRLSALPAPPREVVVLIGPEGGLAESERLAAASAGFVPVSLGPRVLRSETAGLAAMAALLARWGDF
jgi:16S rRNA (uracil1498-N3)-methyltransferase